MGDLDEFTNMLARNEFTGNGTVLPQDEIDGRWRYVAQEVLREHGIGESADIDSALRVLHNKATTFGPRAESKFEAFKAWAKEKGAIA
jgi:hypothetical protein